MRHQPQNMEFVQGMHDFGALCYGNKGHAHTYKQEQRKSKSRSRASVTKGHLH